MITYADYLSTSETQRWMLETDIPWDDIQPELALQQPELLERLRDCALVVPEVPVGNKNDFLAIVTLNQKIHRLTGRGLDLVASAQST